MSLIPILCLPVVTTQLMPKCFPYHYTIFSYLLGFQHVKKSNINKTSKPGFLCLLHLQPELYYHDIDVEKIIQIIKSLKNSKCVELSFTSF